MNRTRRLIATAAAAAAAITATHTTAQAVSFVFDRDLTNLVVPEASLTFSDIAWSQEIGSDVVSGRIGGVVTFHGGLAGCARVVTRWRTASDSTLDTDYSPEVCSNSSLPSLPADFSDRASRSTLAKASVSLQVRNFDGDYRTVVSKTVKAGGN